MSEAENLFEEICKGDESALQFCKLWSTYCHEFDDLVDGDTKPTALAFAETQHIFARLMNCEFYKKYAPDIQLLRILISEYYTESEEMRSSKNPRLREWGLLQSHCGNDMLRFVALVTGGEKHLRDMSRKLRILTLKEHYDEKA